MQIELKCKINVKMKNANRICRCFRGLRRLHIQIVFCGLRPPAVPHSSRYKYCSTFCTGMQGFMSIQRPYICSVGN